MTRYEIVIDTGYRPDSENILNEIIKMAKTHGLEFRWKEKR